MPGDGRSCPVGDAGGLCQPTVESSRENPIWNRDPRDRRPEEIFPGRNNLLDALPRLGLTGGLTLGLALGLTDGLLCERLLPPPTP